MPWPSRIENLLEWHADTEAFDSKRVVEHVGGSAWKFNLHDGCLPVSNTRPHRARRQSTTAELKLVEAVGVEPTSENVTGQEPTYLVQFTRRELPRQIRVLRLERTRNAKR